MHQVEKIKFPLSICWVDFFHIMSCYYSYRIFEALFRERRAFINKRTSRMFWIIVKMESIRLQSRISSFQDDQAAPGLPEGPSPGVRARPAEPGGAATGQQGDGGPRLPHLPQEVLQLPEPQEAPQVSPSTGLGRWSWPRLGWHIFFAFHCLPHSALADGKWAEWAVECGGMMEHRYSSQPNLCYDHLPNRVQWLKVGLRLLGGGHDAI